MVEQITQIHMNTLALLEDLQDRTQKSAALINVLQKLEESTLQHKLNPNTWSVLECIAHLNLYYAFYIPLLKTAVELDQTKSYEGRFKSGWLGEFFVTIMKPKKGKIKKMSAMAKMNPNGTLLDPSILEVFLNNQKTIHEIMEICKTRNLNSVKIPTVMSKWVSISLGDTLRFIVVHNERHLLQAQNCLKSTLSHFN
jgi:TusA-related sulfurtransferase